jgi:hypothetical protein
MPFPGTTPAKETENLFKGLTIRAIMIGASLERAEALQYNSALGFAYHSFDQY